MYALFLSTAAFESCHLSDNSAVRGTELSTGQQLYSSDVRSQQLRPMAGLEVRSLEKVAKSELCGARQRAFADYAMSATNVNLLAMFLRRGYCSEVSYGAFSNEDELVSMTLNGLGDYDGLYTAYDTSTGTAPEYRKQGLATRIFQHMQQPLRDKGAKQYVLEVLKDNQSAKALYSKIGFTVTREFYFFRQSAAAVTAALQQFDTAHVGAWSATTGVEVREASLSEVLFAQHMWDFQPSWQNSSESLRRKLLPIVRDVLR
jgi:ribosomal protein S18 acetylase RimI-like enzyme